MKKIWLATLLKFYAYIMVGIITTLGVTVSLIYWHNQKAETDRIAQLISSRLTAEVEDIYKRSSQWGKSLVENPAKLEGVYKYFSLTPSEYESWRLDHYFPTIFKSPCTAMLRLFTWNTTPWMKLIWC